MSKLEKPLKIRARQVQRGDWVLGPNGWYQVIRVEYLTKVHIVLTGDYDWLCDPEEEVLVQ